MGDSRVDALEGGVELGGVLAAGLGHVRTAATASVDGPGLDRRLLDGLQE